MREPRPLAEQRFRLGHLPLLVSSSSAETGLSSVHVGAGPNLCGSPHSASNPAGAMLSSPADGRLRTCCSVPQRRE
jgi:hypothetical protein